ncbi:MAG: 23S rRNA (adenine(2503)-C(2))-methyltransferase RlmN [Ardenticatenales bacterium]|nr:23S rRNA (adenine(2503)-C(2))-methyltransferase RlmN [Ardenticatenales bacterium]
MDVYDLAPADLTDLVARLGAPPYRARQIRRWLYRGLATSFESMTDLPAELRSQLDDVARIGVLETVAQTTSEDGMADKFLFRLSDGQLIETVLMHYVDPADDAEPDSSVDSSEVASEPATAPSPTRALPPGRHTVCLSTQAGCAMGCVFCATGQMGLMRNLTRGECVAQVIHCARLAAADGERIGNIVFMGMGEPLANWEATWGAVQTFVDPEGLGLSPRRLTISTVGIVPGILRLAAERLPVRLAVSIHAADDALRGRLVAVNETYPLQAILDACRTYQAAGHRRITFEVVLIHGVNDASADAALLALKLKGLRGHVNLIPLNPTPGSDLQPSRYDDAVRFQNVLQDAGIPTTLRMRRGIEISAGCGQLRSRAAEGQMGRTIPRPSVVEASAL